MYCELDIGTDVKIYGSTIGVWNCDEIDDDYDDHEHDHDHDDHADDYNNDDDNNDDHDEIRDKLKFTVPPYGYEISWNYNII